MDCRKVGKLISRLRKEKNMTQKEVADALNISDKAISKWERGLGCPDISLLGGLSRVLGADMKNILSGDLEPNEEDRGNMKRIRFFVCPDCGNIASSTGNVDLSCCGRKLEPLSVTPEDEGHKIGLEEIEGEYYVTVSHEMSKSHYISFVALISYDRLLLVRLYPEQGAELYIPKMHIGELYVYCSQHGLYRKRL